MIRIATHDDIPEIVKIGRLMHEESPYWSAFKYSEERTAATLKRVIDCEMPGIAVVYERAGKIVGGLIAVAVTHWACDMNQACDLGLFVVPEHRGRCVSVALVREYIRWCKEVGAECTIGISTGVDEARTEKLFELCGGTRGGSLWRF